MIKWARGAFLGLNSIQPIGIKYSSPLMDITNGCIPFQSHFMIMICNPLAWVTYTEYPVFVPNDYFWKHHQKDGEEKSDTYCRVLREFLAEELELPLSDLSFRDKVTYRE